MIHLMDRSTLQKHCRAARCFDCMIPRMWPCLHSMRPRALSIDQKSREELDGNASRWHFAARKAINAPPVCKQIKYN